MEMISNVPRAKMEGNNITEGPIEMLHCRENLPFHCYGCLFTILEPNHESVKLIVEPTYHGLKI